MRLKVGDYNARTVALLLQEEFGFTCACDPCPQEKLWRVTYNDMQHYS